MINSRFYLPFFMFAAFHSLCSQITLSHNDCGDIIQTMDHSCSSSYIYYGRSFQMIDFGITSGEEFIIEKGNVGISYTTWGATVQFNIYKIDQGFPSSFSESDLIGSSQEVQLPIIPYHDDPRIIEVEFENHVIVPAGTDRILVEVKKGLVVGASSGLAHVAGTAEDVDYSWYKGCLIGPDYVNTEVIRNIYWPGSDYNFYITASGYRRSILDAFTMKIRNNCGEFIKSFGVTNDINIDSINWDFGDPGSGVDNNSDKVNATHDFTANGTYTITATIIDTAGERHLLQETINIVEPPIVIGIADIFACENVGEPGFSYAFNTSGIHEQILDGRNVEVSYFDGNGDSLPSPLPNPMYNTVAERETITVNVSYPDNVCCFSETTFDLVIDPLPEIHFSEIHSCEETQGFAFFDFDKVISDISIVNNNIEATFFHEDGSLVDLANPAFVHNKIPHMELISVDLHDKNTGCEANASFLIIADPKPIISVLPDLIGCDDNNDGISEYFDTSELEDLLVGDQTGIEITYFDESARQLSSPLPNPYQNTKPYGETIYVRVTDVASGCFSETSVLLKTSSKPDIIDPEQIHTCDLGGGYGSFDLSKVENEIIGTQSGLKITYTDAMGNLLQTPLSQYKNTETWLQTIYVKVEDELNPFCYSETSFNLVVDELPSINLEENYFICFHEPSVRISLPNTFIFYQWEFDGQIISSDNEAVLKEEGLYTIFVRSEISSGSSCENSFQFRLNRSAPPRIEEVLFDDFESDYIKILATGEGDFEYSINGVDFQDSNFFNGVSGGVFTASVRDKKGCGMDSKEIVLLNYPKFFTPNGDGYNEFWQIKGIIDYPYAEVSIFDRYGKLLSQLNASEIGWNGNYNGRPMPSSDYWFVIKLDEGKVFRGHFSLLR